MIWNKTTLADISSKIQYGYTASAIEEAENLPKFLRITDIVPAHIDWKSVPFCEVGEDDFEKYKLEIGDIV